MADGFFQSVVPESEDAHIDIDTSVAHIARVYDYWLGGKDNISQVIRQSPHSDHISAVRPLHGYYSNKRPSAVR